jgi:hypothetical protein
MNQTNTPPIDRNHKKKTNKKARTSTKPCCFRFSYNDAELTNIGFSQILAGHLTAQSGDTRPDLRVLMPRDFDRGRFTQQLFQEAVVAPAQRIGQFGASGGRLMNATCFQLAACALAVRVAAKEIRKGDAPTTLAEPDVVAARLLRRFEKARKRAKRALVNAIGPEGYHDQESVWLALVRHARVYWLFDRRRVAKHGIPSAAKKQREYVQMFVDKTHEELQNREESIPTEAEIRACVRLHLQYVRRGRTDYAMPDLLRDKTFAAKVLADFEIKRMNKIDSAHMKAAIKANGGKPPAWDMSDLRERLERLNSR